MVAGGEEPDSSGGHREKPEAGGDIWGSPYAESRALMSLSFDPNARAGEGEMRKGRPTARGVERKARRGRDEAGGGGEGV